MRTATNSQSSYKQPDRSVTLYRVRPLDDRRFRANPRLERAPLEAAFGAGALAAFDSGGVLLRLKHSGASIAAIDGDTARLFHYFATPGQPPKYIISSLHEERNRVLARLVYERVLQIEDRNGAYIDGWQAHHELYDRTAIIPHEPSRRLDRLTMMAIRYGLRLARLSPATLARSLYAYNSAPRTMAWETLLPSHAAVAMWLGLSKHEDWVTGLERDYRQLRTGARDARWLAWQHRNGGTEIAIRYKIYVSPSPEQVPQTFRLVATMCRAAGVHTFKVGSDAQGILRPDKLVLYFERAERMQSFARELRQALAGVPAQGVPFTSELDSTGLLSCGVDPAVPFPHHRNGRSSWRQYIAERLAIYLRDIPSEASDEAQIEIVLQRIRLDGVDSEVWRPLPGW